MALRVLAALCVSAVPATPRAEVCREGAASQPILQLESSSPAGQVWALDFAGNDRIVAGGQDTVVRVYDLATESPVPPVEIRGEATGHPQGLIKTLAVLPDRNGLFVAGNMGPDDGRPRTNSPCLSDRCGDIRLFDINAATNANGRIQTARLHGHADEVASVAVSPSGALLASSSAALDKTIRFWTVSGLTEREDWRLALPHRANQVSFADETHLLYATGYAGKDTAPAAADGGIGVVEIGSGAPAVALKPSSGAVVTQFAIDRDGGRVAAVGNDNHIYIWPSWRDPSAASADMTGGTCTRAQQSGPCTIRALAFGRQATSGVLFVAMSDPDAGPGKDNDNVVKAWDIAAGKWIGPVQRHDNLISVLAVSPGGDRIASAGGGTVRIIVDRLQVTRGEDGKTVQQMTAHGPSHREFMSRGRAVMSAGFVYEDGGKIRNIAWGYQDPCPRQDFCPTSRRFLQNTLRIPSDATDHLGLRIEAYPRVDTEESQPIFEAGGRKLAVDASGRTLSVGDTVVSQRTQSKGYHHLAVTFDPAGKHVVSAGGNGTVEVFDLSRLEEARTSGQPLKPLAALRGHTADAWAVAYDRTGSLIVTGGADRVVRLWNADKGELIVSLYATADAREASDNQWIMWTPQGFFASSPGGEQLISWQVNRGPDQAAEVLSGSSVAAQFRRPDIIERAILARSAVAVTKDEDIDICAIRGEAKPNFQVITPTSNGHTKSPSMRIEIAFPPQALQFEDYVDWKVWINGGLQDVNRRDLTAFTRGEINGAAFDLPLEPGVNMIDIRGETARKLRGNGKTRIVYDTDAKIAQRGTLRVAAIGINAYPNLSGCAGGCNLRQAVNDANAFLEIVQARLTGPGNTHAAMKYKLLTSETVTAGSVSPARQWERKDATSPNIEAELKELFGAATPGDTSILFIAAHGETIDGAYYLLPREAERVGGSPARSTIVPWSSLRSWLGGASGRKLLFVDTCHAATSVYRPNEDSEQRIEVFTASKDNESSYESDQDLHGYFTRAILQALDGSSFKEVDRDGDQKIEVDELGSFLETRVREAARRAGKIQTPYHPNSKDNNFAILSYTLPP